MNFIEKICVINWGMRSKFLCFIVIDEDVIFLFVCCVLFVIIIKLMVILFGI